MTRILITFSIAIATATGTLKAQNNSDRSVSEPQYINIFYAVDANGKLIDLEHQSASRFHSKNNVLVPGYASMKMSAEFKPGRSSVRVLRDAQFLVKGRLPIDPATRFTLRTLKASKSHREFIMTRAHGTLLGGSATSALDEGAISIRFEEYGVSSYRIIPEHPLAPGEYALGVRGMEFSDLYCFGVDR